MKKTNGQMILYYNYYEKNKRRRLVLTDQMVVSDAERLQQDAEVRRFDLRVLDDQPVYVSDQHERLGQPGEVGHLFGPPVRWRNYVNGARFDGGHSEAAAIATTAGAVTEGTTVATGTIHHEPGYLPGDAHKQVPGHAGALVHHHLGQGHGHQVLGHQVGAGHRLTLLLRPGAGRLVLQQHHEHGAHRQRPQDAHLYGYTQHRGRRVPSVRKLPRPRSEKTIQQNGSL